MLSVLELIKAKRKLKRQIDTLWDQYNADPIRRRSLLDEIHELQVKLETYNEASIFNDSFKL